MSNFKPYLILTLGWFAWCVFLIQSILAVYGAHHPFLQWATGTLLPDHKCLYFALIYISDIALALLLALPFAWMLHYWLPPKPWSCIATAAFMVFLWDYRGVWSDYETLTFFASSPSAFIGIVANLCLLPLAYLVSGRLIAKYAEIH